MPTPFLSSKMHSNKSSTQSKYGIATCFLVAFSIGNKPTTRPSEDLKVYFVQRGKDFNPDFTVNKGRTTAVTQHIPVKGSGVSWRKFGEIRYALEGR